MYDVTIVIPTFNERDNVRPLFELLQKALSGRDWEAVYVDDDSPDGTADEVRALAFDHANVRVIQRIGRRGLAGACIEGILSSTAPFCAVIDADLQHDETRLPVMLDKLQSDPDLDVVIGSRNVEGGSSGDGLSKLRKWGSDQATSLTRRVLKITASDPMSGFFMLRRLSFNQVVTGLQTEGFKILSDVLAASKGTWKTAEVPYTFRTRHAGESKMDAAVTLEFLSLLLVRMTGGLVSMRFIMFAAVGFSGVFVQLAVVRLMLAFMPDAFLLAQAAGVFVAINTNFFLNNLVTYRDRALKGKALLRGLFSFYLVCAFGALMNVGFAELVYKTVNNWALASLAGAVAGAMWNFLASSLFTWRAR
ncbi:dolichol-phosphate mannosyltransferase [Pacificibacter maritimus]|uniref:Dolichol-phosphate mannosyltransferase n=1 Tax=Pacificibacter maritimus TaxID=762213 RepID=A0A3N4UJH1_9RHOB|nr:glycosyltransferase family 2 protein [Pacificibacter maritimus]RPE67429.1 dolichol-phosphate mannosyltransferase [Pacificibacter maritimus]